MKRARPIKYHGKWYPCLKDLAAAYRISKDTARHRLEKNIPLDAAVFSRRRGISIEVNGIKYPTVTACAKALDIPVGTIFGRLYRERDLTLPLSKRKKSWSRRARAVEFDGVRYRSISFFADSMGLSVKKARLLIDSSGKFLDA